MNSQKYTDLEHTKFVMQHAERTTANFFFCFAGFFKQTFSTKFLMPFHKLIHRYFCKGSMYLASFVLLGNHVFGFAMSRIFDGTPVAKDSPLLKSHISILVKTKGDPDLRASGGTTLISRL